MAELGNEVARLAAIDRLKSEFIANVTHELRTPLNGIRLYQELLRRSALSSAQAKHVEAMSRESERMALLIEDLLILQRTESGPPLDKQAIDLNQLVEETIESLGQASRATQHLFRFHPSDRPVEAEVDRGAIALVLTNLLHNAIRYSRPSTPINIRVRGHHGKAVVEVEDSGPAISSQEASRIFEAFYTGRPEYGETGTGLGLAVVKAIVEKHNGSIALDTTRHRNLFSVVLRGHEQE